MKEFKSLPLLAVIGPGLAVAATGVGAGDLATGSFAGNRLGVAVLWAVVIGAGAKFVLNEGLARWQLVTGQTLLEGCVKNLGWPFQILFLAYLLPWSLFVGSALVSACAVAGYAIYPSAANPEEAILAMGALHSLAGLLLARLGGYWLFEKVMTALIAAMFSTVLVTALLVGPEWGVILEGLVRPRIPQASGEGITWTVALMGGVGGTLTILCYGYWIRERQRFGKEALTTCRIDLAVAYVMTAVFGIAMVIIGSQIEVSGRGAELLVALADRLEEPLGWAGRWIFLVGAWAALFSSLLGVWQSVPYIFADFVQLSQKRSNSGSGRNVFSGSGYYRGYQYALALIPLFSLGYSFQELQKVYSVFGALFMPFLAVALLYLNGKTRLVGAHRNSHWTSLVLVLILLLFAFLGWQEVQNRLG